MLKNFRFKIIFIQIISFLTVTSIIVLTINIVSRHQLIQSARQMLLMLSNNSGIILESDLNPDGERMIPFENGDYKLGFGEVTNAETPYSMRYFSIFVNSEGAIEEYNLNHIAAISTEDLTYYAEKALAGKKNEGSVGYYRYLKSVENGMTKIYFVDCYSRYMYVKYLLELSLFVAAICMLLASVLVYFFSGIVIKPMEENIKRQKIFFSDASHELKTPVAAISANIDVLELMSGETDITKKLKRQTKQLIKLINDMLILSKIEDFSITKNDKKELRLSDMVNLQLEDIETRAIAEKKHLTRSIQENVLYHGIENDIYRLCSVLFDNAVKYCDKDGTIDVTLKSDRKAVSLFVHNTCNKISESEISHLFDRFYKGDSSRNRSDSSYGIGLSIASAIVEKHKGKITIRNEGDGVTFEAVLFHLK